MPRPVPPAPWRLGLLLPLVVLLLGADWPMWRYDAQRTAASPAELPGRLHLLWTRDYPALRPAWPDQAKMQFDAAYEPVVAGKRLFVGSSRYDTVTALDTQTGRELWTFTADGPVRFAPLVWEDTVYFASDDGHLYALAADSGSLRWRFRGGPSDRRILGNGRLISTWPARGAPVIADGTIYFAAGIWPFMGIFLHALDARTGDEIWTNDGDGSRYMTQPHGADSFAGVAPQGPLAVIGHRLLIPGGRSVPACYDRRTGKFDYYQLAENSKRGGGSHVAAAGNVLFNGGAVFSLDREQYLRELANPVVLGDQQIFGFTSGVCRSYDLASSQIKTTKSVDRKGKVVSVAKWTIDESGSAAIAGATSMIRAGSRLYVGADKQLSAIELPLSTVHPGPAWQLAIEGAPTTLVAADDKLFAVTREGRLYAFGGAAVKPQAHKPAIQPLEFARDTWTAQAKQMLASAPLEEGCCVVWGIGSGRLFAELLAQSKLQLIVLDPDATKVHALREQLRRAGIACERVAVHVGTPGEFSLPPYLASLVVSEDLQAAGVELTAGMVKSLINCLRPYGGIAWLPDAGAKLDDLTQLAEQEKSSRIEAKAVGDWATLARVGPLVGAGNWTHEHADAGNSRVSRDLLVKAPLGLLWFGGPSHEGILPRHGHGPQPQVIDGRILIEGVDLLRAIDIYTGAKLWETSLPGFGKNYNQTAHQPGANASGTNYISMPDGIYAAVGSRCVRLDPATGKQTHEFHLPPGGDGASPNWGYINVAGEYLIGGGEPVVEDKSLFKANLPSVASSRRLVVMNRHTGEVLWTAAAANAFRHNAICLGNGRLYCIDRPNAIDAAKLARRGNAPKVPARLIAFDLATGEEVWSTSQDVFGTWLSYSDKHDVLVEAGRVARDTLLDEPAGMRAYRASAGQVLWFNKAYVGPAMIHGDTILKDRSACDLLTGKPVLRDDPLTGEKTEWTWTRNYGCNTPMASEHLLTFRSGAAGYVDLCNDGGTGNFGGFRSSCTNNLLVGGGVLCAPDYTRTCTCSYQNQTSLALVHEPDAEMWTFFTAATTKQPIRNLGVNLGAPGDRKDADGTLWLEYPSVGGSSPSINVKVQGTDLVWFRRHDSQVTAGELKWVAASGVEGLTSIVVGLGSTSKTPRGYAVRLHFIEPGDAQPGERVFSVSIQGRRVIPALDVVKEAGGKNRSLVKEFQGVQAADKLELTFEPADGVKTARAVLCGIEIKAQGW